MAITYDLARFYHFDATSFLIGGNRIAVAYQKALESNFTCPEPTLSPSPTSPSPTDPFWSTPDTEAPSGSPTSIPTYQAKEGNTFELKIVGNNGYPLEFYPLKECQGDCDSNDECIDDLVCLQRDAGEVVPGCLGSDETSKTDYCIHPSLVPSDQTSSKSILCQIFGFVC